MAHYTYIIDQGPISRLCPQLTPNNSTFYGSQKEYETQKVARAKGPKRGKESCINPPPPKKNKTKCPNFSLHACTEKKIEILHIFVPNLGKSSFS